MGGAPLGIKVIRSLAVSLRFVLGQSLPSPSLAAIEAGGAARPPPVSRAVSIFMGLPGAFVRWLSH